MDRKDKIYLGIFVVFGILFLFIVFFHIHSHEKEMGEANKKIEALLDANMSLVERVVEFEEKERKIEQDIEKYILRINRTVPPIVAKEISKNIIIAGDKHNLPLIPIVAVMERESHFNPTLRSSKGARGLMQVMPVHLEELGLKSRFEYHDIEKGIDAGAYVLKKYLKKNGDDMQKALLEYVHYDPNYVKDVYNSMGKFIVFKGLSESNGKEVLVEQEQEVNDLQSEPKVYTYTVIEGDTLSLIAEKHTGKVLDWVKIHKLNPKVVPERLQIGMKLIMPKEMKKPNKI